MDEVKRWNKKHDLVGWDLPVFQNQLDKLAQEKQARGYLWIHRRLWPLGQGRRLMVYYCHITYTQADLAHSHC